MFINCIKELKKNYVKILEELTRAKNLFENYKKKSIEVTGSPRKLDLKKYNSLKQTLQRRRDKLKETRKSLPISDQQLLEFQEEIEKLLDSEKASLVIEKSVKDQEIDKTLLEKIKELANLKEELKKASVSCRDDKKYDSLRKWISRRKKSNSNKNFNVV